MPVEVPFVLIAEAVNVGERQVGKDQELGAWLMSCWLLNRSSIYIYIHTPGIQKSQGRRNPGSYQQSDVFCNPVYGSQHGERLVLCHLSTPEWDEREGLAQQKGKEHLARKESWGVWNRRSKGSERSMPGSSHRVRKRHRIEKGKSPEVKGRNNLRKAG